MPKPGTYKRTPKAKALWRIRRKPEGWQIFNETTGRPLGGYWSRYEIAEKQGRLFFAGSDPLPETPQQAGLAPSDAQASQISIVPAPVIVAAPGTVDVPASGSGGQRPEPPLEVPPREVGVEGGAAGDAPVKPRLTPHEACEAVRRVFRAHKVTRPVKR